MCATTWCCIKSILCSPSWRLRYKIVNVVSHPLFPFRRGIRDHYKDNYIVQTLSFPSFPWIPQPMFGFPVVTWHVPSSLSSVKHYLSHFHLLFFRERHFSRLWWGRTKNGDSGSIIHADYFEARSYVVDVQVAIIAAQNDDGSWFIGHKKSLSFRHCSQVGLWARSCKVRKPVSHFRHER